MYSNHESVSRMLLYAKTDEAACPDHEYKMSCNTIAVRTLNLDKDFSEIKKQLDEIVERHLYGETNIVVNRSIFIDT